MGVVFFMSLLVHEYGHALTAMYFGARPVIFFEAFGGRAHYDNYGISLRQQFFITLNGPLVQGGLIVLSYLLLKWGLFAGYPYVHYFLYVTMRINIFWFLG